MIMGSHGGETDQTHKSHDNAPAVATGIGCGWRAQAALGSKTWERARGPMEVSLNGDSLRAPSHPQSIHPVSVSIPSWRWMPHEAWCWLLVKWAKRGPQRVGYSNGFTCVSASPALWTHPRIRVASITVQALVFKWRGWLRACGTVRQATYLEKGQRRILWINWGYRILNQMCDQVASEIVPRWWRLYGNWGEEEEDGRGGWREEEQEKLVTYRGSATEKIIHWE